MFEYPHLNSSSFGADHAWWQLVDWCDLVAWSNSLSDRVAALSAGERTALVEALEQPSAGAAGTSGIDHIADKLAFAQLAAPSMIVPPDSSTCLRHPICEEVVEAGL